MKMGRNLRLVLVTLMLASGLMITELAVADAHCYEDGNCNVCDFWDGEVYRGFVRWCPREY